MGTFLVGRSDLGRYTEVVERTFFPFLIWAWSLKERNVSHLVYFACCHCTHGNIVESGMKRKLWVMEGDWFSFIAHHMGSDLGSRLEVPETF